MEFGEVLKQMEDVTWRWKDGSTVYGFGGGCSRVEVAKMLQILHQPLSEIFGHAASDQALGKLNCFSIRQSLEDMAWQAYPEAWNGNGTKMVQTLED